MSPVAVRTADETRAVDVFPLVPVTWITGTARSGWFKTSQIASIRWSEGATFFMASIPSASRYAFASSKDIASEALTARPGIAEPNRDSDVFHRGVGDEIMRLHGPGLQNVV